MRVICRAFAAATPLLLWASVAQAHGGQFSGASAPAPLWLSQGLYVAAWFAYAFGAARVRPSFQGRLALHGAMLVIGLALFGPFDDWAASSTALHMVQHMLLVAVAAPLLVIAVPLPQWRAVFGQKLDPLWRALMRASRYPMACAALHAAALWIWHAPRPYMIAVLETGWHVTEHACFLFSGWLFWWAVLRSGRRGALGAAMALLFTVMHTGLLGALLTFAREPLYWRESQDLEDQQLAGLVMWVPGSLVYLAAAAWVVYRMLLRTGVLTLDPARAAPAR